MKIPKIYKKLTVTILTALFVGLNDYYGKPVSDESVMKIAGIAAAFILGQGLSDFSKGSKQ